MKISYTIPTLDAGGMERQLLYLVKSLCNDYSIQIIVYSDYIFYKEFYELPIDLVIINSTEQKLKLFSWTYKALKKFKPDIIHNFRYNTHLYTLPYAWINGAKIINGSIRWGGKLIKTKTRNIIEKLCYIFSDIIISNSKQGLIVENLTLSNKTFTVHNGFNISYYDNNVGELAPDLLNKMNQFKFKVVMVGRFASSKDYITYIKAAKLVLAETDQIGFFCVGDGENRNFAEQESSKWLNKNIYFLGKLSGIQEILHYFNVGVLLNNTNGHAEGISNSIMEYMAAELPVIATNTGGTPELVKNCLSGFLVPAFNEIIVADKIKFLYDNPYQNKKMGQNGREIILKEFNIEKMSLAYQNIYKKLSKKY